MDVVKRQVGRNHYYVDADDGGRRLQGVTTILKRGMPNEVLARWHGNATAEWTLDNWEELNALPPSERLRRMKGGRYEARDEAANKGRLIHRLAERIMHGETVEVPQGLEGYVNSCIAFLNDYDFHPLYTEALVYSETHKHAGQLDAIGDFVPPELPEFDPVDRDSGGRSVGIIDWKSGRSRIYGDTGYQLTGYRHSEWMKLDDGEIIAMPEVDVCLGVHLTPKTYEVVIADTSPDAYRDFLFIMQTARIADKDELDTMVSEPLTPARPVPWRLAPPAPEAPEGTPEGS